MRKGGIKIIFLFLIIIIMIIFSAAIFSFDHHPEQIKEHISSAAQEKIEQGKEEIIEKVADSSKEKIGEVLRDTGEKILREKYENPGYFGLYDREKVDGYDTVILFFIAQWCPTCTVAEENIQKKMAYIPPEVAIMMIDYDDADMRERYDVNRQHTFVLIDENMEEIKRWTNTQTLDDIIYNIK